MSDDLPSELRTLVTRYGTHVLDDPDGLRATLDDFLDEDVNPGDVNLVVDAVRFGSLDRLSTLLDQGADPAAALVDVAEGLAQRRGGDAESAFWACAALGYAADLVPADLVPTDRTRRSSVLPPSHPAVSASSTPTTGSEGAVTDAEGRDGQDRTDGAAPFDANATRQPGGPVAPEGPPPSPDLAPSVGVASSGSGPSEPNEPVATTKLGSGSRRWRILAAAAALVVVAAVGLFWWQQHDNSSTASSDSTDGHSGASSMSLPDIIASVNDQHPGVIPPDTCPVQTDDHVECAHTQPAVYTTALTTYMSLDDLYAAYKDEVENLSGKPYAAVQNTHDCNEHGTGEVSWNHDLQHPNTYTLAQVASGKLTSFEASGRIFCTVKDGRLRLVWTDNIIKMMGEISGAPQSKAYEWWHEAHHDFDVGMDDGMTDSGSETSH